MGRMYGRPRITTLVFSGSTQTNVQLPLWNCTRKYPPGTTTVGREEMIGREVMMTPGETIPLKPGTMTMLPEDGLPNDNGGTTMMQRLVSGSAKATAVPKSRATVRNRHSLMAGHRLFLSGFCTAAAHATIKFDAKI
jgi:hypothetical protein